MRFHKIRRFFLFTTMILLAVTAVFSCGQRENPTAEGGIPLLIDVAAEGCIPCDMMAPALKELRKEYNGKIQIRLIDMLRDPADALKYGVRLVPTQIFFDARGKELFRHTGYMSKEDLIATFTRLGMATAAPLKAPK